MKYSTDTMPGTSKTVKRYNTKERRFDVDTDMEEIIVNEEGRNDVEDVRKLFHIVSYYYSLFFTYLI